MSIVVVKTNCRSLLSLASLPARLAAVFVLATVFMGAEARASERWATLEAIHQLENPQDLHSPGRLGELGAYQFREQTWKLHTAAPFSRALDRRSSDAVAVKYYDWIAAQLERHGIAITPYNVALAWNGGIRAAVYNHPPAAAVDYATRAANLAAVFSGAQIADAR
jgi:hypothetical protein